MKDLHLIPFKTVCQRLGIAARTGYNQVSRQVFPLRLRKVGRSNFVLSSDLDAYLDDRTGELFSPAKRKGRPSRSCN